MMRIVRKDDMTGVRAALVRAASIAAARRIDAMLSCARSFQPFAKARSPAR